MRASFLTVPWPVAGFPFVRWTGKGAVPAGGPTSSPREIAVNGVIVAGLELIKQKELEQKAVLS